MKTAGLDRLTLSLLTFVVWVAAVMFSMRWADDGAKKPLVDTITHGVSWNIVIAIAVLAAVTWAMKWRDLGFKIPDFRNLLKIIWFPAIYLLLFLAMAVVLGLPPLTTILFVLLNTALVGLSEEWMFRGVLFNGLKTRFAIWPAILLTCLLFGSVHVLNVVITGELGASLFQALNAAISGLVFMALLIRTGSLWVPIVYHALWDFGLFVVSSRSTAAESAEVDSFTSWIAILPLLILLPNALYALYLLRGIKSETRLSPL